MRVTNSMMVRTTMRDVSQSLGRLQQTQSNITSGRAFTKGSEDPGSAASAMTLRQDLRRVEQRMRTVEDAKGWVSATDTQLNNVLNRLDRAKQLAVQAGNAPINQTPAARQAIAAELRAIRSELIGTANSNFGGRALFAGTAAGAAYDANGAYLGNNDAVIRDVTGSTSMTVNLTGTEVFGTSGVGAGSLFEVIDRLANAVASGDSAAAVTEHANFDVAFDRVRAAASTTGTRSNALDELSDRATDDKMIITKRLSDVEDVDIVDALVRAKAQETSYQAAVQAAARVIPVSLMDYLR